MACSAARPRDGAMSPDSSIRTNGYSECRPDRLRPCSCSLADLLELRADRNHVSGWSLAKMRSFCHVNAADRNMDRACHLASSGQRLSLRLSAVVATAAPLGCSPTPPQQLMNHQPI